MLPARMEVAPFAHPQPSARVAATRARRTRAFRATIELCASHLATSSSGRFARACSILTALITFGIALSLRITDGPAAPVGGLLLRAAGITAWLAAGTIALRASKESAATFRENGVEALVAAAGITPGLLRGARTLGTTWAIARTVGVPLAALGFATAGLAADVPSALRRMAAAFALLAWSGVVGVTLAALAAAANQLFPRRGQTALIVFVFAERAIAQAMHASAWSIPGALHAALSLLLGATGVGGGR